MRPTTLRQPGRAALPAPVPTPHVLWSEYVARHGGNRYAALHDLRLVRRSVGRCRTVEGAIAYGLGLLGHALTDDGAASC